jgi:hypothetical protein
VGDVGVVEWGIESKALRDAGRRDDAAAGRR